MITWCWLVVVFRYHYLCVSTWLHRSVLVIIKSRTWSCLHWTMLSTTHESFYRWRFHTFKIICSMNWNHLTIWVFDIRGSYVHLLVYVVFLSRILVGKSTTSSLEKPFLIDWVNNILHELTWFIWHSFILNVLSFLMLYFHRAIWVMKLLIQNLCETLRLKHRCIIHKILMSAFYLIFIMLFVSLTLLIWSSCVQWCYWTRLRYQLRHSR